MYYRIFYSFLVTSGDDRKYFYDAFSYKWQRLFTVYIPWKFHVSIWKSSQQKEVD